MFRIILQAEGKKPQNLEFDQDEITIGRLSSADITLKATNISKQHSRIVSREGKYFIIDRKSTNGTFLNGDRVTAPRSLKDDDKIFIGDFSLTFVLPDVEAETGENLTPPPMPPAPPKAAKPAAPKTVASAPPVPKPKPKPKPKPEPAPEPEPEEEDEIDFGFPEGDVDGIDVDEELDADLDAPPDLYSEEMHDLYLKALSFDEFKNPEDFVAYSLDNEKTVATIRKKLEKLATDNLDEDIPDNDREQIMDVLLQELLGFGALEEWLADDDVEEVFVNGPEKIILLRQGDKEVAPAIFSCEEALFSVLVRMLRPVGVEIDDDSSMLDVTLPEGRRVICVLYPYSPQGTSIRITKPKFEMGSIGSLEEEGAIDKAMGETLREAVGTRKTIAVVSPHEFDRLDVALALGATIPEAERIAVVKMGAESRLPHEDQIGIDYSSGDVIETEDNIADMLRHIDRMAVDRLVARDLHGESALELLYAINNGLLGSIFTVFGASAEDGVNRLVRSILTHTGESHRRVVEDLVGTGVDMVVYVNRFQNGQRRVSSIFEVDRAGEETKLKEAFHFVVQKDTPKELSGRFKKG